MGVSVVDAWGFPLTGAAVDVVVADIPEYSVYSTTDPHGMSHFWIEAPPGTLVSVFVDGFPYGSDHVTLFTDEYTTDIYVDVTL